MGGMADLTIEQRTSPPTGLRWPGRRRGRRPLLVALAAVLLAAAVVGGRWWQSSAEAFDTSSGMFMGKWAAVPGTAYHFGGLGGLPGVEVVDASLVFADGSALATGDATLCLEGYGFGGASGDLADWCPHPVPLAGADLSALPRTATIQVSVVPLSSGTVTVTGLRVSFRDGWRTGVQTIPLRIDVSDGPMPALDLFP